MYTAVLRVGNEMRLFRAHTLGVVINRVVGELSLELRTSVRDIEHLRHLEEDPEMNPSIAVDVFLGDMDELSKVDV